MCLNSVEESGRGLSVGNTQRGKIIGQWAVKYFLGLPKLLLPCNHDNNSLCQCVLLLSSWGLITYQPSPSTSFLYPGDVVLISAVPGFFHNYVC